MIFAVVIFAAVTLTGGNYGLIKLYSISQEREALIRDIEAARLEYESLLAERKKLDKDLEYLEKIAREKYNMVRDGEEVYIIETESSADAN